MDYNEFYNWLICDKNMAKRSAKDVVSRCKRVSKMIETEECSNNSLKELLLVESYKNCSMFIKSQLKRAITLLIEFREEK